MTGTSGITDAVHSRMTVGYWLAVVALYTWAPFFLVSLSQPRGLGMAWDFSMLAGLSALSGFAVMPLLTARSWSRPTMARWMPRLIQRLHNDLSWWLAAMLVFHVAASLFLEPLTIEYLTWRGSPPMLAGLMALVVAVPLFAWSLPTLRRRSGSPGFWRVSHTVLSVCLMLGAVWHVVGAGYYVRGVGPSIGLMWVGLWRTRNRSPGRLASVAGHRSPDRTQARRVFRRARLALLCVWLLTLLLCVALPRLLPPLVDKSPCTAEPCL
jgi:hypothetical protein